MLKKSSSSLTGGRCTGGGRGYNEYECGFGFWDTAAPAPPVLAEPIRLGATDDACETGVLGRAAIIGGRGCPVPCVGLNAGEGERRDDKP